jgi:PPOX class probable F420-dependent enzyme
VAHHGREVRQPVPKLIWFYFDGTALFVYTMPSAAKVAHVKRHPLVSLNLDSDGNGGGIVVIGGEATIDAEGVDCRTDEPYWAKYAETAEKFGVTDAMAGCSTRLRLGIDKVWLTPMFQFAPLTGPSPMFQFAPLTGPSPMFQFAPLTGSRATWTSPADRSDSSGRPSR